MAKTRPSVKKLININRMSCYTGRLNALPTPKKLDIDPRRRKH